jgi:hypothetical protein
MTAPRLTSSHLLFTDPETKRECRIDRSPLRAYGSCKIIEGIIALINAPCYHGVFGNSEAEAKLTTLAPKQFFIRYSKKEKDFVLCCQIKAWNPTAGFLGKGKYTHMRINLGDILAYSPGGQFKPELFKVRKYWSPSNTNLLEEHYILMQQILDQIPGIADLCSHLAPIQPGLAFSASSTDIHGRLGTTAIAAADAISSETKAAQCAALLKDDPVAQAQLSMLLQLGR